MLAKDGSVVEWSMVANRALAPCSKHAVVDWLAGSAYLPRSPDGLCDERLYRAMDFLMVAGDALQKAVFFQTADLLNLEVDLLLYDTTSVYCEMDEDDRALAARAQPAAADGEATARPGPPPQVVNDPPLRLHGQRQLLQAAKVTLPPRFEQIAPRRAE